MPSNTHIIKYQPKIQIGEKFGKLTYGGYVGHREGSNGRVAQGLFICDCGKECIKDEVNVRRGHTKSCSRFCAPYLGKDIALENALYEKYKRTAKDRDLEFTISKEEFIKLSKQSCTYCGIEPKQIYYKKNKLENLVYNGIDRYDNTKGYIKDNCVTCCIVCNRAKNNLSMEDFLNWIERISLFRCRYLYNFDNI